MVQCDDNLVIVGGLVCVGAAEYHDCRHQRSVYACGPLMGRCAPHAVVDPHRGRDFLLRHAKLASAFRVVDKVCHGVCNQV